MKLRISYIQTGYLNRPRVYDTFTNSFEAKDDQEAKERAKAEIRRTRGLFSEVIIIENLLEAIIQEEKTKCVAQS